MTKRDIQERSFEFACRIVQLYKYLVGKHGVAKALARQVLRAGTSVGANMEEAHAAQSRADFVAKCSVALKEARETKYWLRLLAVSGDLPDSRLTRLINESSELIAILTTIRRKATRDRTKSAVGYAAAWLPLSFVIFHLSFRSFA
jgi:four helix bundle protein